MHAVADVLVEAEEELGRIDAFAGDGDHGQGMRRGSAAAKDAADQAVKAGAGTASVLAVAGDAWSDRAGGTSGALWGLLLRSWSAELSDNGNIDDGAVVRGGRRALDAVTTLGRAKPGDKTLVDAFVPFMETLENAFASGKPLADAWKQAAEVAKVAAEATAPLTPKLGRARPLAEKSIGHPDAGAISLALVAEIVGKKLKS
ncbi:PTS-dependent dihydroxyacetone kinase, ADP-binding subunit DhaL [compost metagenome]